MAPGKASLDADAVTATVIVYTAGRNCNASLFDWAPCLSRVSADAVAALIEILGACGRDGGTRVSLRAPCEARLER